MFLSFDAGRDRLVMPTRRSTGVPVHPCHMSEAHMMKRAAMVALLSLTALSVGTSASAQDDDIVYSTIYYSDASHTTQVGFMSPGCGNIPYRLHGTQTAYWEEEPAFRCVDGVPEPI